MTTKSELIASFDNYVLAVIQSFAATREAVETDNWEIASELMTKISTAQARMSVGMQSAMMKLKDKT